MQSAKLLPFQVVACFVTLVLWTNVSAKAFVQLQSLFIHILSSKGSLETVNYTESLFKVPTGFACFWAWWMSNSALGPAWPQQGLCAGPAFLGAVAVGIMQFAEHRLSCPAEGCMLQHKQGTCPFPSWANRSHFQRPVCILIQEITGSLGFSPSVTQWRTSRKYLYLDILLQ